MIFGLYAVVSNFSVNFALNLMRSRLFFRQLIFYRVTFFHNEFCWKNQSRLVINLKIPVSCTSGDFSFYRVVFFLIRYIFCDRTNQIFPMMSLTNLRLTPDPLVRTLLALSLFFLTSQLVVLVFWGLIFFAPIGVKSKGG